jgi:glutaminyl-tRNA synthetase
MPSFRMTSAGGDPPVNPVQPDKSLDFVRRIILEHEASGRFGGRVHTRFPPEPNGYLHIGHAKALLLNYGLAVEYGGKFNLRFDDTNPVKEEQEYIDAIQHDIRWLGCDWGDQVFYASDYFEQLYEWAVQLIRDGKAYVDSLTAEQIREYRGTAIDKAEKIETRPGRESPYRNRSVAENLDLFQRMRDGEFPDGAHVLRAKIDMAHPNLNMRDPVMYRILRATHQRTGDTWCIYPTYDWAHGQSDSIEGITHSICSLEFENHRPLYDWYLDQLAIHHPQQIEFARLNLNYTVMSKRRLLSLVADGLVSGWDDPRLPTLSGLRRRGVPPEAIRSFAKRIGVAKTNSVVDVGILEEEIREHLNKVAPRAMAVLRPVKLVVENYPPGQTERMEAVVNPEDPAAGTREVPFSRELYVERDDVMENPPKQFFRLFPGNEVRLRSAYLVTCTGVVKDARGDISEVRCNYDPASRGGSAPDGRRVKATLHWVSAAHAVDAEVRLYDRLFVREDPDEADPGKNWLSNLNPQSLEAVRGCKLEPALAAAKPGERFQFERLGYFCADNDGTPERPVFNRTVSLRDSWAKIQQKTGA